MKECKLCKDTVCSNLMGLRLKNKSGENKPIDITKVSYHLDKIEDCEIRKDRTENIDWLSHYPDLQ